MAESAKEFIARKRLAVLAESAKYLKAKEIEKTWIMADRAKEMERVKLTGDQANRVMVSSLQLQRDPRWNFENFRNQNF
jgi:hypothetical protein